MQVWANRSGPVAGTVLTGEEITARAIATGIAAVACLAIMVAGLSRAVRWLRDRRRLATWAAEWAATGPQWAQDRYQRWRR